jgi:hypothetical protein
MPEKILYILGAGASAQALPISRSVFASGKSGPLVPGLAHSMRNLDFNALHKTLPGDKTIDGFLKDFSKRLNALSSKADEFGDVDTYAKYLQILEPGGLRLQELKKTVSEFFVIKQVVERARDRRYLQWLVSIMDRKKFPENIKILCWNYDFQVQLTSTEFGDLEDVHHEGTSFTYGPSMIRHYQRLF